MSVFKNQEFYLMRDGDVVGYSRAYSVCLVSMSCVESWWQSVKFQSKLWMAGESLTQDRPSYKDVSSHRAGAGQGVCGSKHARWGAPRRQRCEGRASMTPRACGWLERQLPGS